MSKNKQSQNANVGATPTKQNQNTAKKRMKRLNVKYVKKKSQ